MDWNRIEGNWKQAKGKIKEKWGNLTDDDLDKIAGRRDQLEGKIQEVTGSRKTKSEKTLIPGWRVRRGRGPQMALTKSQYPKLDRNRVDVSTPDLARHWRKCFGKSEDEIANAIAKVGDNVETVKKELSQLTTFRLFDQFRIQGCHTSARRQPHSF